MDNSFFLGTQVEALAMLYLQNQNLQDKTPEELYGMYQDAYNRLNEANIKHLANNPPSVR